MAIYNNNTILIQRVARHCTVHTYVVYFVFLTFTKCVRQTSPLGVCVCVCISHTLGIIIMRSFGRVEYEHFGPSGAHIDGSVRCVTQRKGIRYLKLINDVEKSSLSHPTERDKNYCTSVRSVRGGGGKRGESDFRMVPVKSAHAQSGSPEVGSGITRCILR